MYFLWRGVVSTSPNPQAGGPPLVGCPQLLIQFTHSYPPYRRPFLHPQPEDAPCRGDRDPHPWSYYSLLFSGTLFLQLCIIIHYIETVLATSVYQAYAALTLLSSSSSICHGVGPLVDPFRSHVSRSLYSVINCTTLSFIDIKEHKSELLTNFTPQLGLHSEHRYQREPT
jgi:hypothetical protein